MNESLSIHIRKNKWFYIFLLPGVIFLFIFNYIPLYGLLIAFKNFTFDKGIWGSDWVGLDHFRYMISSKDFWQVARNSVVLSLYRILWGFPAPIILALMMNEIRLNKFKRSVQTIVYLPHFISWVVMAGMITNFVNPGGGLLNIIRESMGLSPIAFLQDTRYFRTVLIFSEVFKECGWGTIIYLAAMTGIDPELYEAAMIDRAGRFQRIWHVTLPGIKNTIIALLILRMGSILRNGFEQIFLLQSPLVYSVSDVFETYTYRTGLMEGRYSYASAVGLIQSVVGFVMIFTANNLSRKYSESSLW